jgi:hypothetical protein
VTVKVSSHWSKHAKENDCLGCGKTVSGWARSRCRAQPLTERWTEWDYGRDEKDKYLFAPSACSFDFPVAMHYAIIPLNEVLAEEARLYEGIATVEQKWFTSLSELLTYRNRLSSRLRLVQHGLAIRNPAPGGANPLPPYVGPDSEFAKVRYRFFDVNVAKRRGK